MSSDPAEPWLRDVAAVAQALFATHAGPPPAARIAWLVDDLAHFLATVGGRSQLVFRASLRTVTLGAPAAVLQWRAFATLPLELRVTALDRLERGPLGLALFAVKTLLCFIWYEHPDSAIEVGLVRNVTAMKRFRGSPRGAR